MWKLSNPTSLLLALTMLQVSEASLQPRGGSRSPVVDDVSASAASASAQTGWQRQMKQDKEEEDASNDGDEVPLEEPRDCTPFASITEETRNHRNTNEQCKTNTCPGGCCRIYEWMLCDEENRLSRLPCVCNENTVRFTDPPTSGPTISAGPTVSPSISLMPSSSPTKGPTTSPSESPTGIPTASPTPRPSDEATMLPTATSFTTQDTTDDDDNPVRSTACLQPPANMQFVTSATYTYEYQLYAPDTVDPSQTVEDHLSDQIHDAVAGEFFRCTFDEDSVWRYQSTPQAVTNVTCIGAAAGGERCFVVSASETIWAYDALERRRKLQVGLVSQFVKNITEFINDSMAGEMFNGPEAVSKVLYIDDGTTPISTPEPVPVPTGIPTTAPQGEGEGDNTDEQEESDGNDIDQVNRGNPTVATDSGASAGVISVISVAGALLVIVAFLTIARRRRYPEDRDGDVLKKAELDGVPQVTTMEEHVDLDSIAGGSAGYRGSFDAIEDPYTSYSPANRLQRAPLYAQDELDQAVGDHGGVGQQPEAPLKQGRQYRASDTVNL